MAAFVLNHVFGLSDHETSIKMADQVIQIYRLEFYLAFDESLKEYEIAGMMTICDVLTMKMVS